MKNNYFTPTYFDVLGEDGFRSFCYELARKDIKYDSLNLYPAKGRDGGIDAKKIATKDSPVIFQYKFRDIIRWALSKSDLQNDIKIQFKKWCKQMSEKNQESECIFVTNVSLKPETHAFFENIIKKYSVGIKIIYWEFESLVEGVKMHEDLREKFFPHKTLEENKIIENQNKKLEEKLHKKQKFNSGDLSRAQQKLQNLFIDKQLKYKYYYLFIDLFEPFYLDKRGEDQRKKLRQLFDISQKKESEFMKRMIKDNLVRIVGGNLCLVNDLKKARNLQNEIINKDAINLYIILKLF